MTNSTREDIYYGKIEDFFNSFNIKHPAKKASFMIGNLVNFLLYVQRKERNASYGDEPFRSKLYGLMLDELKIKKIFSQAVQKLNEYKTTSKLEEMASKYLLTSEGKWDISRDEISYYFTLGLCMGNILKEGGVENE